MGPQDRFYELLRLASERSGEKRRDLLRAITDMFLENPEACGERMSRLFDDVACRLADDVDATERRVLADRIADINDAPRGIIRKLAHDEIGVADPILRFSPALQDEDLIEIATVKDQAHILAMTQRRALAAGVTEAIAKFGDKTALRSLSGNRGAMFSENGASILVSRSGDDRETLSNLYVRDDLPDSNRRAVQRAVKSRPGLALQLDEQEGKRIVSKCVIEFAEVSRLSTKRVQRLVFDGKPEMLVIITRTLDLSRIEVERLLQFRIRRTSESELVVGQTLQRFDVMPREVASRVVRFLRTRQVHDAA